MHSGNFLEQYVIIEWDERVLFPQCYLTMVDDGRESCIFVSSGGCTVYNDRPGACRAYPVGRGATARSTGDVEEILVLVSEPHCLGFSEHIRQTAETYFVDQGMNAYSRFNDMIIPVTQHKCIKDGYRPSRHQLDQYLLALYNLDLFRQEFSDGRISLDRPLNTEELQGLAGDDEKLLVLGIQWLQQEFLKNDS
jgi:Fe-S-cluster containining protein